jgi:predicted pyridoxine 5'-phosphate oxidase superfamily flavin-nucleotide-binding protein
MGKVYERLDDRWRRFIAAQPLYFVATAPSGPDGHVNVSPKGYADTFAIFDDTTVGYLDLDGSGIETIAHLRQNGRVTVMFCSFGRTAKILRLYGTGRVVVPADPDWDHLVSQFGQHPGVRSIIVVDVDRIADSCGYSIPTMTEASERDLLDRWATRDDVRARRSARAGAPRASIDGLPALTAAESDPAHVSSH